VYDSIVYNSIIELRSSQYYVTNATHVSTTDFFIFTLSINLRLSHFLQINWFTAQHSKKAVVVVQLS